MNNANQMVGLLESINSYVGSVVLRGKEMKVSSKNKAAKYKFYTWLTDDWLR